MHIKLAVIGLLVAMSAFAAVKNNHQVTTALQKPVKSAPENSIAPKKAPATPAKPAAQKKQAVPAKTAKELQIVVAGLQKHYGNINSFKSTFTQTFHMRATRKKHINKGTVYYMRPGKMHWHYNAPNEKLFIINQNTMWYHKSNEPRALVDRCFDQNTLSSSLAFLIGSGNILADFSVAWFKGQFGETTDHHIVLTPKVVNTFYKRLILVLAPDTFAVKQSIVVDPMNNVNQFIYDNLLTNIALSDNLFRFTPKKGVRINPMPQSCKAPQKNIVPTAAASKKPASPKHKVWPTPSH